MGVFVQAERPFGRAHVTAGLRGDAYFIDSGDVERQFSPSLAIRYPIADGIAARASVGSGFRVPSIAERFVDDTSFLPLAPNAALRPETSLGLDFGLRFARGPWEAEATLFATRYRHLTEAIFVPNLEAFQFRNVASARTLGAENRVGYRSRRWNAWVAYQLIGTRDDATGQPLPFRPSHLAQAHAGWTSGPWAAGTFARYQSAPGNTQTDFARFVPDADQLGDARVIDLYARAGAGRLAVAIQRAQHAQLRLRRATRISGTRPLHRRHTDPTAVTRQMRDLEPIQISATTSTAGITMARTAHNGLIPYSN